MGERERVIAGLEGDREKGTERRGKETEEGE